MQDDASQVGYYDTDELVQQRDESSDMLSQIEPLSDESLQALGRLARYKPPLDTYPVPAGRAAVLVALFGSRTGKNLNVLLSTRSKTLRTFPGHVALPGGKMEAGDMNLEATARREAFEEVGLPYNAEKIRYLTTLPPYLARNLLLVTPVVVFVIDYSLKPELNADEVDTVFSFPLSGFLSDTGSDPSLTNAVPKDVITGDKPYHTYADYEWFDRVPSRFHSFETNHKPVTGLTAGILIQVAEIAYGRKPAFGKEAPGEKSREELFEAASKDPRWKVARAQPSIDDTPPSSKL
ncbi:BZ3500_MvSof-1268-A1-R1_Chr9g10773 [Microbotryum saponariae]|uniref:BZ3500_MvSof-1268-A1-R1_Chr9g10773 protein n=1 Tax=Microbotryum saponariae TaxID=289078 RepID=A0A2X0LW11_9BASI|nr:BZ3501_MvSof-1269-A2-R1_Chr9g10521 [Microbotryum saponariae]SDA00665.1 BZ3500_MvSof-1268-A1-R1_Chr9g10773 [Microbotryum saponariae]